jgi:PPOX class probable F420-dependent enzyme
MSTLAAAPYVLLTTFRRSGVGVSTPVWVGADGDDLLVTTRGTSGKVKRIRNGSRVTLVECDRQGNVEPGAIAVEAHAVIETDDAAITRLVEVIESKYGDAYRRILAAAAQRPPGEESVAVRITL